MSVKIHTISNKKLTFSTIFTILKDDYKLKLSGESKKRIQLCRKYLDKKTADQNTPTYGINTGFGSLYSKSISHNDLGKLQENLVKSHACGIGDEVPKEVVKLMILLKIQSLSYGHSGVQLITINRLIDFFNNDVIPVVYQLGSLGASGDLAPLAHMSLPLIGLGEVYFRGSKIPSAEALNHLDFEPIKLQSKEDWHY